jgi:hypothetical protein
VRGLKSDQRLLQAIATELSHDDRLARELRLKLRDTLSELPQRGGLVRWLRSSPLAGVKLNLKREWVEPRKIDFGDDD